MPILSVLAALEESRRVEFARQAELLRLYLLTLDKIPAEVLDVSRVADRDLPSFKNWLCASQAFTFKAAAAATACVASYWLSWMQTEVLCCTAAIFHWFKFEINKNLSGPFNYYILIKTLVAQSHQLGASQRYGKDIKNVWL